MSQMLEQAIIDATALKDAAVKNAETLVLEKYSRQIKDAVENLLEQEDPLAAMPAGDPAADEVDAGGLLADSGPAPDTPAPESNVMEHIPLAVTSNDNEKIEIPLDKLLEEIKSLNESYRYGGDTHDDPELQEARRRNNTNINPDSMEEDMLEEIELEEYAELSEGPEEEVEGDDDGLDEVIDLDEIDIASLMEELIVDIPGGPVMSGWAGTPAASIQLAEEELLALEQDSKVREEKAAIRAAVNNLLNVNENIVNENKKLRSSVKAAKVHLVQLRDAALLLNEKFEDSNLTNARLLYQNKTLTSDSLNERQKDKLVEAISRADTIEEAKVIFDTLQSTVGSASRKAPPKSLGEAVQKSSSIIMSAKKRSREESRQKTNPTLDRWKFLAGIDKK
tara:strand:+ start:1 stop:1182 length:1182 start_codon:yes stop_codon:yes gene_type:complete